MDNPILTIPPFGGFLKIGLKNPQMGVLQDFRTLYLCSVK